MKTLTCLLAASALALAPVAAFAKIVRTVERTFTVQPGGRLTALTEGGNITIETADTNEVRVLAKQTLRTDSEAEADKILQDLALRIEQQGSDVVAEAKYARERRGAFWKNWPPVSVDLTITVPRHYNLGLTTSGGDVRVASVRGDVKARTSGGNLKFDRVDGDLEGRTSGGDISLNEGTARTKLHTSGGNVTVRAARGPAEISTSGGDIRIDGVTQLVSATTSGGNVRAVLTGPIKHDTVLSTSGGNVVVRVAKDAGFNLDARTSGGNVRAGGLTLKLADGGVGKSRLAGEVNGGGPQLKLRTSGGNITLETE